MAEIKWGENRNFISGLDRGVIYPQDGEPVAWNGLVSVDEDSDQESSTYYVDGRRYLTTVTPREYAATIEAYTFPPTMSSLLGIAEAADGLYLDEQNPLPFGLSYRTMVNGGPHYRIHLLTNLTGIFKGYTAETHSDELNPANFEIEVQGTPQAIEGFRPTVHAIIETTNMDPDLVSEIEDELYGRTGNPPAIPAFQSLFERMNYGDILIIRSPGDGTFTIEGSYKYIDVRPDGSFEVTNLKDDQVVLNPDGKIGYYDLTLTP